MKKIIYYLNRNKSIIIIIDNIIMTTTMKMTIVVAVADAVNAVQYFYQKQHGVLKMLVGLFVQQLPGY
jgi:hypothetical protein